MIKFYANQIPADEADMIDFDPLEGFNICENYLQPVAELADQAQRIYDDYARAMVRRSREPICEESFMCHFFPYEEQDEQDEYFAFGSERDGYLLGVLNNEVFTPSHFAPRSLRGGYRLFWELGVATLPAVLAITDDLAATLGKIPCWLYTGITFPSWFRGCLSLKKLVANEYFLSADVQQFATTLLSRL